MKIAFVSQPFDNIVPPVKGGSIGILTYQFARHLARCCDVIIYSTARIGRKKVVWKEKFHEGVRYRYLLQYHDKLFGLLKGFPGFRNVKCPFFGSNLYCLGHALQLAIDLRAQKCDVVHIHNYSQFVPIIRAFNPKIKIVLHMHCEWLTQLGRTMIERRLEKVDLILGVSEYITNKIRRHFPQFANRCQTVYNGVDVEGFVSKNNHNETKRDGAKRLLFVGRVSPEKGVHVLLEAFQKVVEHRPQAQLEIVGKKKALRYERLVALSHDPVVSKLASFYPRDRWLSYLSQWQDSSSVASQVSFTGFVPNSQLVNHYRNADVFILPSVWDEPFGMPIIEAMATGVSVVATRGGAFPEIVEEGKTGLLVEPDNATTLAGAILHLLSDEDLRKSMEKFGRQRVLEYFSWERVTESLLSNYKETCNSYE